MSVEKRLAITLWKLATNIEYRSIAQLFGLGRSTVCTIVLETCKAITEVLLPRYVKIPQGELCKEAIDGFDRLGFPRALDGTHIPIIRPVEDATDYYNRKGFHSIIMQGAVDYRGIFIDVCLVECMMHEYLGIPACSKKVLEDNCFQIGPNILDVSKFLLCCWAILHIPYYLGSRNHTLIMLL